MWLVENVMCILLSSDVFIMKVKGKLLSENGDMILEMGELDVDFLIVSYYY